MTNKTEARANPGITYRKPLPEHLGVQIAVDLAHGSVLFYLSPANARQLAQDLVTAAEQYETAVNRTRSENLDMFPDAHTA